ncbi:MAG: GntR family transcriptional regulator [Alphaproteobacteria bacterium]|nr:GntR family transcriptional regulator [Alphaproteobacteria bacterium]
MAKARKSTDRNRRNGGIDVFGVLRERIASHALPPGSRLREQDMATELGVSRARIREAFGALEQRGLIERIQNRGAVVVRLDTSQMFDLYDARGVLESYVARLAAERAPQGAWDALIEDFGAPLEKALAANNYDRYLDALEKLHRQMIEHAGNGIIADMLDLIYDKTRVITRRLIILPGRAEIGLKLHRQLLDALARRDAEASEKAMREILSSARAYLERFQNYVI